MAGEMAFVSFKDAGGNRSYVRVSSISAIYHDGKETHILLSEQHARDVSLKSIDMPDTIIEKIRAMQAGQQVARR